MDEKCTIYRTSNLIGKKWTLSILLELYKGKETWKRYSHIKEKMKGITPKILSARLKELEKEGLIKKKISAKQFPIKSEYSLSESGADLIRIIKEMKKWALHWKINNAYCEKTNCKLCEF